jgi:hypothetical protein
MAVDTAAARTLTLLLADDLAAAPARGVERAVDQASLEEGAALLAVEVSALDGDVWLLRRQSVAVAALLASRDPDGVTIAAIAGEDEEYLLRAVLGHYALEGVLAATLQETVCSSLGSELSTSWPSSVTATRSSIRTPT